MGWALHEPASKARFPEAVKKYLTAKFNLGEKTGEKAEPHQVAQDMRNARNENGDRLFHRDQWLTKDQIKGFFSRLAAARRKAGATNAGENTLNSQQVDNDVADKQWMDEVESLEEEQER